MKTNATTEFVLIAMRFLAWVAFIGFMIEAGVFLVSYGLSYVNPEGTKNVYKGMNLFPLRQFSQLHYSFTVFLLVSITVMKSLVWLIVIKILSKVNLMNPFTMEVSQTLGRISFILLAISCFASLADAYADWLMKLTGTLYAGRAGSDQFFFMAGLMFIISQVFKRGVEIQSENDLTV